MTNIPSMQQLLEAGVHFGHQVRRGNPRMGEYIFGAREGVHIINLEYSEKLLQAAADYAQKLGEEGKVLLFVGTKKQAQPIIKEVVGSSLSPFVNFRWIGGTLTNFEEVRRNIKKLLDAREKLEKGELSHYTKKERLIISRRLEKFDREFGGIAQMEKLPDAIFIVDIAGEKTAVAEATRMGIPVIGIADSNSNPLSIEYPIAGNDDATKAIKILTETIGQAYLAGKSKAQKAAAKQAKKDEDKKQDELNPQILAEVAEAEEKLEKEEVVQSEKVVG